MDSYTLALGGTFINMHYVCFTWLFFNSDSLPDALDYMAALVHNFFIEPHYAEAFLAISFIYFTYPIVKNFTEWFIIQLTKNTAFIFTFGIYFNFVVSYLYCAIRYAKFYLH